MEVIRDIANAVNQGVFKKGCVLTIGNFDGFHLAHKALLEEAITSSRKMKLPSALMTFHPHPRNYFAKKEVFPRLMTLREKWLALQLYPLDYLLCLRFTQSLADLPAIDFVNQILVDQLNVKLIIVGDDFHFGASKLGDYAMLKQLGAEYGFEVKKINAITKDNKRISSKLVRNLLAKGQCQEVIKFLGQPYSLFGPVIYGDQRGRTWGFPTANIPLYRKIPPLIGIYIVRVHGPDFIADGVASIGFRPVFQVKKPLLEVHILDFDRDIYGEYLRVEFVEKIRDEADFESVDLLIKQIADDVVKARVYFSQHAK